MLYLQGARLKPEVLAITVHGLSITDMVSLSVDDAFKLFRDDLSSMIKSYLSLVRFYVRS